MSKTTLALCIAVIAAGCTSDESAAQKSKYDATSRTDSYVPSELPADVGTRTPIESEDELSLPSDAGQPITGTDPLASSTPPLPGSAPNDAPFGKPVESSFDADAKSVDTSGSPLPPADAKTPPLQAFSESDRRFVMTAYSGGLFEIESAQWAMTRFTEADEREHAQMLIRDHTKANQELALLALRHGLELQRLLQPDHQRLLDELRSAPASEQVRAYESLQLQAHRDAIAQFEIAARMAEDAELKVFAERTLPLLRTHLEQLQKHADGEHDDDPDGPGDDPQDEPGNG